MRSCSAELAAPRCGERQADPAYCARRHSAWRRSRMRFASSRLTSKCLSFPAWDGVPYDRVAPNAEIVARRMATLAELASSAPDATKAADRAHHGQCRLAARSPQEFHRRREPQASARQRRRHGRADRAAGDVRLCPRRHRHRSRAICRARRHSRPLSAGPRACSPRFLRRHAGADPRLRSRDAADARPARSARAPAHERDRR